MRSFLATTFTLALGIVLININGIYAQAQEGEETTVTAAVGFPTHIGSANLSTDTAGFRNLMTFDGYSGTRNFNTPVRAADFKRIQIDQKIKTPPYIQNFRLLDLNQDRHLNEFDIKRFQDVIDTLNGSALTGLQLQTRFKTLQKNQSENFPETYDLNRDGLFSPQDVDLFTELVSNLDEGATKGEELVHQYRVKLFPHKKK